jgi:hypothetical protein
MSNAVARKKFSPEELTAAMSTEDLHRMRSINTDIQAVYDDVFMNWGFPAPQARIDEFPIEYRRRMAAQAQILVPNSQDKPAPGVASYSELRNIKLDRLDDPTFFAFEPQYQVAAKAAAERNDSVPLGEIRTVKTTNPENGQVIYKSYGQESFVKQMNRGGRRAHIWDEQKHCWYPPRPYDK